MKTTRPSKWILAWAVAALPMVASNADAQYRVNQDGRALDANNRIGSGGVNTTRGPAPGALVTGNDIVTGTVTGGREFRGNVPYVNPRYFRGNVAGQTVDDFIKNSVGVPAPNQGPLIPGRVEPFYGGSRLAEPPPPGFTQMGFTGTYTPSPLLPSGQLRSGRMFDASPYLSTPTGNQLHLRLDESVVTASPLLGLRQWNLNDMPDLRGLSPYGRQLDDPLDRLGIDQATILQMRQELIKSADDEEATEGSTEDTDPTRAPDANLAKPLPNPFGAPDNQPLSAKPIDTSLTGAPLPGHVRQVQSMGARLLVPPTQQSGQYAELQRRLERYYSKRLETDQDRHREFLKQLQAKEAAEKAARQADQQGLIGLPGSQADALPDYSHVARELAAKQTPHPKPGQADPRVDKPQPMQITSLAEGVRAPGLARVLREAEELAQEGKFASAVDQYALANAVAPNNPLVWLGKAHAELGAGFYRRAELDLHRALSADPTLLMGQYDLKGMLGQERLEFIVRDLKETARKQQEDPGPVLLLAYLAYNTGNEQSAVLYLTEVEKRVAGKADRQAVEYRDFVKMLRLHWSLPDDGAAAVGGTQIMALSEVLKQFEEGNVASATLTNNELRGQFRSGVTILGQKEPVKSFRVALPAAAATGPLSKWLQEHKKGALLRIETEPPAE